MKILRLPTGGLSLSLTAVVVTIFFLVLWTFPTARPGSETLLISELLETYSWVGSYDQRMSHLLALVALAAASASAFFATRAGLVEVAGRLPIPSLNFWICLAVTVATLLLYQQLVPHTIVRGAWIFVAPLFIYVVFATPRTVWTLQCASLVAIGAYLSFVIVPGLLTRPIPFIAPNGDVFAQVELHLNTLTLPGPGLSAGQNFFKELPYNYGLLMPSVMSVIDRRIHPMSVGDQAQFVQYCQVLFALIAAAAYLCYRPRNWFGVFVALLLAAPYWSSAHPAVWHPNQSGFRALTFPLGIFALVLVARLRPRYADWWLGAVGGVAALINAETAVAVGIGYLVYSALQTRNLPFMSGLRMAAAVIVVIVSYFVVYRVALGRLPFGTNATDIFATLLRHTAGNFGDRLFSAGPSKENYYIVPFALVMFGHSGFVIIDAFRRLGSRSLSPLSALRAAIASILVVWLSYYFNFPNWWQIWTHLFLYGFLVIDLCDLRRLTPGTGFRNFFDTFFGLARRRVRMGHAVVLVLLALMISHTNQQLLHFTREFMHPYWTAEDHSAGVVSGLLIPHAAADELKQKADALVALNKAHGGNVLYLTYNVTFIPSMSRIFEPVPERNLFSNIAGDAAFDPTMNELFAKRPAVILIDAPTGPLAVSSARKAFQDRVRRAVSRDFELTATESGWQIWRPRESR